MIYESNNELMNEKKKIIKNILIQPECTELIKNNSKDMHSVIKDFYLNLHLCI